MEAFWRSWFPKFPITFTEDDEKTNEIACNSITNLYGQHGCPLVPGQKYKYKREFDIIAVPFTEIYVDVEFILEGNNGVVSCFGFKADLQREWDLVVKK